MRVRTIIAISGLTLCLAGAAADAIVMTSSSAAATPLVDIAHVLKPAACHHPTTMALSDKMTSSSKPSTAQADRGRFSTATGTAVGLMAGILIGGLASVIFGLFAGLVLTLFAGAMVVGIPLVASAFGPGGPGHSVAGGLVGLLVGAVIGLLGVATPAALTRRITRKGRRA